MTAEVIPPRGTEWEWLIEPPESCPCGDDDPEGCMNLNFGYVYGRLMPHGPIPDKPEVQRLIDAALKLADTHDATIDGEYMGGEGDTRTEESEAVRTAVAGLKGTG